MTPARPGLQATPAQQDLSDQSAPQAQVALLDFLAPPAPHFRMTPGCSILLLMMDEDKLHTTLVVGTWMANSVTPLRPRRKIRVGHSLVELEVPSSLMGCRAACGSSIARSSISLMASLSWLG